MKIVGSCSTAVYALLETLAGQLRLPLSAVSQNAGTTQSPASSRSHPVFGRALEAAKP